MQGFTVDSLRSIAAKVDTLLEALHGNGGAGRGVGPAAPGPAAPGLGAAAEQAVVPHLQRLVSTLEPTKVHQAIVESAVAVGGADRAILFLLEDGKKLRFKAQVGIDPNLLGQPAFAASRELVRQVLQEGRPITLGPQDTAQRGLLHLGGIACLPIVFGLRTEGAERVGGALYVDCGPGRPLGSPAELLQPLADHAAIALENAFLFQKSDHDVQQIRRLKDNIAKLYEVGQSLNSTLILDELLIRVVDHVVEISRAQRGFVMLREEGEAAPAGPRGASAEAAERKLVYKVGRDARQRTIASEQFAYSSTVAQQAISEKRSVVKKELIGGDLSTSMVQMDLQAILCVPLLEKDQVIGLVYVDSQQSNREFDDSDKEIVESLCGQASVAIINAKLYQEATERERLTHELNIAARLQSELLPKKIPQTVGLEMYGFLTPATEVGGDYYDFIPHEGTDRSVTIAIGDVSGKGVGAGLVMAMARSALRSIVQHTGVPRTTLPIMQSLNVMLCRDIPRQMFLTLNLLLWDADARALRYTPAGHEHLIIYRRATGQVEKIKAGGVACGVLESASAMLKEHTLQLAPGDQVLLYTDGVTEAMDLDRKQFGLDQTVELVRRHGAGSPEALCTAIHQAIIAFRGAAKPHDDITLVALRVAG